MIDRRFVGRELADLECNRDGNRSQQCDPGSRVCRGVDKDEAPTDAALCGAARLVLRQLFAQPPALVQTCLI